MNAGDSIVRVADRVAKQLQKTHVCINQQCVSREDGVCTAEYCPAIWRLVIDEIIDNGSNLGEWLKKVTPKLMDEEDMKRD
jgi:hypothetical protein